MLPAFFPRMIAGNNNNCFLLSLSVEREIEREDRKRERGERERETLRERERRRFINIVEIQFSIIRDFESVFQRTYVVINVISYSATSTLSRYLLCMETKDAYVMTFLKIPY